MKKWRGFFFTGCSFFEEMSKIYLPAMILTPQWACYILMTVVGIALPILSFDLLIAGRPAHLKLR